MGCGRQPTPSLIVSFVVKYLFGRPLFIANYTMEEQKREFDGRSGVIAPRSNLKIEE